MSELYFFIYRCIDELILLLDLPALANTIFLSEISGFLLGGLFAGIHNIRF